MWTSDSYCKNSPSIYFPKFHYFLEVITTCYSVAIVILVPKLDKTYSVTNHYYIVLTLFRNLAICVTLILFLLESIRKSKWLYTQAFLSQSGFYFFCVYYFILFMFFHLGTRSLIEPIEFLIFRNHLCP